MDTTTYWDPFDSTIDDNAHAVWRQLRDLAPVYRNEKYDFWALSRYHDIEAAHLDTETFSSAHGTVLERMIPGAMPSGMMIFQDPPAHTRLRLIVSRAFNPRRIAELEVRIRALCGELLDPVTHAGTFDYVQTLAAQLPSRVISSLVGVPPEDQERQRQLVDQMFHIEPDVGMANQTSASAAFALIAYLADLVEQRTREPRDDLISDLVKGEIPVEGEGEETRPLTSDECTEFALLLYTAGTETVAKLLGNAAVILAEHPDQRADLHAHPELIRGAVEEILRYEPPSPVNGRWTTRAVTLHGVTIPQDSKVLLLNGSAGRDERAFVDPDRFDVHRETKRHLSFGYGVHHCLGAALARMEGRVAIEETLMRFPSWEIDYDRLERVHTSTVRGFKSVPLIV